MFRSSAAFAIGVGLAAAGHAAEFKRVEFELAPGGRPIPAIEISGEISQGDDIEFRNILRKHRITESHLIFNSPGGDLATAVRLARVIREYGFMTAVAKNGQCLSACFVLYAAGFVRQGQASSTFAYEPSAPSGIGVHRAYESRESMRSMTPEQARTSTKHAQGEMAKALLEFDVPETIVAKVNSVPSNACIN
jgi:hypothetical protein